MKTSHKRILDALARGGAVRCFHSKRVHVAIWVSYGVYETFTVRRSTIDDMEELGLIACVDRWAEDQEWIKAELPQNASTQ